MSKKFFYDLHLHSCLSPCADNDMTPNNIAGMASVKGLQLAALTDHNTCGNCAAFFYACERYGIIPVAGMELTTSEEIHMICLFPTLETALDFNKIVAAQRMKIKNRPDIFGEQIFMDRDDKITGYEEIYLSPATSLSIDEAYKITVSLGGAAFPAHIDREANGILSILGDMPDEPDFNCVEIRNKDKIEILKNNHLKLLNKMCICSSDAHYLWDISEAENSIMLDCQDNNADTIRKKLIQKLNNGNKDIY